MPVTGFVPFDAFLLSMQAAGAIFSIKQAKGQQKLIKMGRQLEQAAFESNLENLRAQNAESSLASMQELRSNVSAQIALNAARGSSSGAGSGLTGIQTSERTAAADEKARRMNLLTKENELRASNVLSGLHTLESETKLGQSLTGKLFDLLPASSLPNLFGGGKKSSKTKSGYGLDEVGG